MTVVLSDSPSPLSASRRAGSDAPYQHEPASNLWIALVSGVVVTGIMLNHPDWFSHGRESVRQIKGRLEAKWITGAGATVQKLEVVKFLRRAHAIKGAVGEFRIEEAVCDVSFKGPGYSAILNDLHKDRDSGRGWSLIIDLSVVLMVWSPSSARYCSLS